MPWLYKGSWGEDLRRRVLTSPWRAFTLTSHLKKKSARKNFIEHNIMLSNYKTAHGENLNSNRAKNHFFERSTVFCGNSWANKDTWIENLILTIRTFEDIWWRKNWEKRRFPVSPVIAQPIRKLNRGNRKVVNVNIERGKNALIHWQQLSREPQRLSWQDAAFEIRTQNRNLKWTTRALGTPWNSTTKIWTLGI